MEMTLTPRKIMITAITVLLSLVALVAGSKLVEVADAGEVMVVQSISGKFSIFKTAGPHWQGLGKVTKYKLRRQFWFSSDPKMGGDEDKAIKIRFNDNGQGKLSGSIAWEMPVSDSLILKLHRLYGSDEAIDNQLINTVVGKSVFLTGPLMSSTESNSIKRNDLLSLISDQVNYGVYKTNSQEEKIKDQMTGQDKTVRVVSLIPSSVAQDHGYARQEVSPLEEFGIRAFNLSIDQIHYDSTVEKQIQQQQQAIMQVQTALAEAKTAEQAAITAEKNGQALAAKAKWEQEVIKAKEVTSAEQRKEVARLDAEAADYRKLANIRDGEGEARKRELIMNADGALSLKLATYEKVNQMYATAIEKYTGNWVPQIVWGGGSGASSGAGSGAMSFIDMLTMKSAKDLSLDMSPKKGKQ